MLPDAKDCLILRSLQRDGRIPIADLAELCQLSPAATGERFKRLLREGYIASFTARVDPVKLGYGLLIFVQVSLDKTTPDIFDRFAAKVRTIPEVLECHMVAGGFDYLVKARVVDMAACRRFLGEVILTLPGVTETRTFPVMDEVKSDAPLPI